MDNRLLVISAAILVFCVLAMMFWPRREGERPASGGLARWIGVIGLLLLLFMSSRVDRTVAQQEAHTKATLADAVASARATADDRAAEVERLAQELAKADTNLKDRTNELQREIASANEEKRQVAQAAAATEEALRAALSKVAEFDEKSRAFIFRDSLPFAPGSAEIDCQGRETLAKLVGYLAYSLGVGSRSIKVSVVGHTDDRYAGPRQRTKTFNQTLSEARANTVRTYLIGNGIPPEIIVASGLGMSQPVGYDTPQADDVVRAANTDPKQRALNRRVTVSLD